MKLFTKAFVFAFMLSLGVAQTPSRDPFNQTGVTVDLSPIPQSSRSAPPTQTMPLVNMENLQVPTSADRNPPVVQPNTQSPLLSTRVMLALGTVILVAFFAVLGIVLLHPEITGRRRWRANE